MKQPFTWGEPIIDDVYYVVASGGSGRTRMVPPTGSWDRVLVKSGKLVGMTADPELDIPLSKGISA